MTNLNTLTLLVRLLVAIWRAVRPRVRRLWLRPQLPHGLHEQLIDLVAIIDGSTAGRLYRRPKRV